MSLNFFGLGGACYAQDSLEVKIPLGYESVGKANSEDSLKSVIVDDILAKRQQGYLLASLDSLIEINKIYFTKSFDGEKTSIKYKVNFPSNIQTNKEVNSQGFNKSEFIEMLEEYENIGFPFARYQFSNVQKKDSLLQLSYDLITGPRVVYDSIIVKSSDKINVKLVQKLSGIKKGDVYSERTIVQLKSVFDDVTYITMSNKPQVVFREDGAHVYMYLKKKPSNVFNGILGIQPDNITGQVRFTGDLQINLTNAFGQGENTFLNWKKIEVETQELDLGFNLPYLAFSNFGIRASLNLYKQDSTFINVNSQLGINYSIDSRKSVEFFILKESDNNLSVREDITNLDILYYGLKFDWINLDQKINPRNGFRLNFSGSVGEKNINLSQDQSEETPQNTQFQFSSVSDFYFPINKRNGIKLSQRSKTIFGNRLYENEMIREGGLLSIRGFDQNSITNSSNIIGSIEYRYYLEQGSFAQVFYDQMWFEKNGIEEYSSDYPIGIGAGFSFQTNSGVFSFTYAMGKTAESSFLFRNGKVHFGYINFF